VERDRDERGRNWEKGQRLREKGKKTS